MFGAKMNRIIHTVDHKLVNLYPLGDFHIGSSHYKDNELKEWVEKIKEDPYALVVIHGDIINNAIKTSVSDIYDEQLNPEQSIDKAVAIIEPIKDKIIGITSGNHEDRTYKITGIDVMKNFAYRLGKQDYYSPISNLIFLSWGDTNRKSGKAKSHICTTIYMTHGLGGGRTIGAKANQVARLANMIDADIYIHGHTHSPIIFKENYIKINKLNKGYTEVQRLFVNTNSTEGFGNYGERFKLSPTNRDFVVVELKQINMKRHTVKAFL
jgi:predicted phosphodiesterase